MIFVCCRCRNKKEDFQVLDGRRLRTCNRCREEKKRYAKTPKGMEVYRMGKIKYLSTDKGKTILKKIGLNQWRLNRMKILARCKVYYALRTGKLTKKPCLVCGEIKTQAHHEDYNKALDVTWLCVKHHNDIHKL